ncbi:MAG: PQQ-binding-like beta-propeller repeat protein [Planctomycetia bacterium]|nr:PQQ-binding-like beta-propeller repeat protein [Planctomycetia bacterium]
MISKLLESCDGWRHFIFLLALAAATDGRAEETSTTWPQWRGPARDGKIVSTPWPEKLNFELRWRKDLGPSYSGPVIAEDRVFTTETRNERDEILLAFDRKSGKELWRTEWAGAMNVPFFAKSNGDWIRATPAYDGKSLYVAGMRDVLVSLDAGSGDENWRVDFVERFKSPLPAFGFVCSPLVTAEAVYVQAGAGLVKLDRNTGETQWRSLADEGGMWGSAFSSPLLTEIAGQEQLLAQTRTRLVGVNPKDGAELWTRDIEAFRGMNILTPTVYDDSVITSSYGGKTILHRLNSVNGTITVDSAWEDGSQGYMSSPLIIEDHAFLHLRNRRFACFDLRSGKQTWRTTPFAEYWSLVANGDRILALDCEGQLRLIRANPERYEELDSVKVADAPTWAHLAVCGDEVVVRELNALSSYRWRSE